MNNNRFKQPKTFPKQLHQAWGLLFFIVSIALGIFFSLYSLQGDLDGFQWQSFFTERNWLGNPWMIVMTFSLLMVIIFTSGLRFQNLFVLQKKLSRFKDNLVYGILARYYVLITPWALGSQPILIGMMYKRNIPIGVATSAVMMDLLIMRLSMAFIVFIALLGFGHLVPPFILILAWIGFLFTCIQPVMLVLASLHVWIERGLIWLIQMLFPKRKEQFIKVLSTTLNQYRESFKAYKHYTMSLALVVFFSILSQVAVLALPYVILASFSADLFELSIPDFSFTTVFMMAALANVILGVAPTLGSAGAAEFTFATVFSIFLKGPYLLWAIFIWRFILFYAWLLMGVLISLYLGVFRRREQRRFHLPNLALPLKVFMFNDGFYPIVDGVVRAVDGYARYLVSQGVDVTVIVPYQGKTSDFPYRVLSIPQFKVPGFFYPIPYGYNKKALKEALYYDGPAIYHAHTPFILGQLALKLSKQYHIPLVTTFHSKYYDDYFEATKNKSIANILKKLTIRYFKKSQAIWTVSPSTVTTIRDYGIHDREIRVFSNGTDIVPHPEREQVMRDLIEQFEIKQDEPILLFVGQLIWQKNIQLIIDTAVELNNRGYKFQLLLVGDGRNEKEIKKYLQTINIPSRIILTGKLNGYKYLSALYSLADVFFFPSAYDNDPLVIKEAAAHQLPSLVLEGTSVSSLIQDHVNGFVHQGDARSFAHRIITILEDKPKLKQVGEAAERMLVKRWEETLKDLVSEYKNIIQDYYS